MNQEEVLKEFPVDTEKYPNVFGHHCTHIFKPTDKEVEEFKKDNRRSSSCTIEVIGRLQTEKVDVLLLDSYAIFTSENISTDISTNKHPHITLATAEGVKPFESNAEILKHEKEIFKSISGWQDPINAFPGLYTSDNKVKKFGKAVIVDIDRTLCNIIENGRSPYDWDRVAEDEPIEAMCQLVRSIREKYYIVLLTGRSEDAREGTEKWLKKNRIYYDKLLMKASGSYEKSTLTKYESYVNDIKDEYDVAFAIDDDQRVVDMWSEKGILCLKV